MCIEKSRTEILVRESLLGQLLFGNKIIFVSELLSLFFIKIIFLIYNILFSSFYVNIYCQGKIVFSKKDEEYFPKGGF